MIYLLIAIILHTYIFVCFKLFQKFKIDTFEAIVFNYCTCVITGITYSKSQNIPLDISLNNDWWGYALVLGCIFISTFYAMALCSQKVGVSVSATAAKMALIIPVSYSFFISKTSSLTLIAGLGIVLALTAIYFTSYKEEKTTTSNIFNLLLITVVFIGSGGLDLIINHCNNTFQRDGFEASFGSLSFLFAASIGLLVLTYQNIKNKSGFKLKNLIAGILLGIPNYFSIYFVFKSLSALNNNGALVFPTINIGTIILSTSLAVFFFSETLNWKNKLGLACASISIVLLNL